MKILISGSTGMIGSALLETLRDQGHEVARLVRPDTQTRLRDTPATGGQRDILWDPIAGQLDATADGADAVVHLAGASIADGRWTPARKRVLQESRIAATRHLVNGLGKLPHPPQIFVASSAIGFYGDRGDEELAEDSAPGPEFLAQLCHDWEAESSRAKEFGARVVTPRFGIVLAKNGGALPRMLLPFKLGAGGRLGSGKQWMSWISLRDIIGILIYSLENPQLSGPANAVSPHPVRNAEFTQDLGHVLHRPTLFPAPGFALRMALGEMADALLLSSQRVLPKKLEQLGYKFKYSDLESALEAILR